MSPLKEQKNGNGISPEQFLQDKGYLILLPEEILSMPRGKRRYTIKKDPSIQEGIKYIGKLKRTVFELNDITRHANEMFSQNDHNLSKIIWQGEPYIYKQLELVKRLGPLRDEGQLLIGTNPGFKLHPGVLSQLADKDFYNFKVGPYPFSEKVSFSDIESMQLDDGGLADKNIQRIDKLFQRGLLKNYGLDWRDEDRLNELRSAFVIFATQKIARPDVPILLPDSLQDLYQRATEYFDYYTDILLDEQPSMKTVLKLNHRVVACSPYLPYALGSYIPARLGITPSSAVKMIGMYNLAEAFGKSKLAEKVHHRTWIHSYILGAENAYRKNNLPKDLEKYQYYDKDMDVRVRERYLQDFKSENCLDEISSLNLDDLQGEYGKYHKMIHHDIRYSPTKRLEMQLKGKGSTRSVIVTSQNPDVTMFIIKEMDGKDHLTLELGYDLDDDYRLYGFSYSVSDDVDRVNEYVAKHILHSLITVTKQQHPEITRDLRIPVHIEYADRRSEKRQLPGFPREKLRSKDETKIKIIRRVDSSAQPAKKEEAGKHLNLIYDKQMIWEAIRGKGDKKQYEDIMDEVKRLERGEAKLKVLKVIKDSKAYRQKVNRYRLLWVLTDPDTYELRHCAHRNYFYRDLGIEGRKD